MEQRPFGTDDFADNPEPRVPCVLLLDVSASMRGRRIAQLSQGLRIYKEHLTSDPLASKRVEVAVVTFGGRVDTACDFVTADRFAPPSLRASGKTPMGEAIHRAVEMVEQRKQVYRSSGIAYYRPWLFMITDGAPTDDWQLAAERVRTGEESKSLSFFAVGVSGADFATLQKISTRRPLLLKGLRFDELFEWLSNSQQSVSRSSPGEQVPLSNPATPDGWASLDG